MDHPTAQIEESLKLFHVDACTETFQNLTTRKWHGSPMIGQFFSSGRLYIYVTYSIVQKKSVITILLIVWVLVSVYKRNFPR